MDSKKAPNQHFNGIFFNTEDADDKKKEDSRQSTFSKRRKQAAAVTTLLLVSLMITVHHKHGKASVPALELSSAPNVSVQRPRVIVPGYHCTPEEAAAQANGFDPKEFGSNCPSRKFWPVIYAAGLTCRDLVMIDVGANKGYLLAEWLDLIRPELGITPKSLYSKYINVPGFPVGENVKCGACGDCRDGHQPSRASKWCKGKKHNIVPTSDFSLKLYGLEPEPSNLKVLEKGLLKMFNLANETSQEHGHGSTQLLIQQVAAVEDEATHSVKFKLCPPGAEDCGIEVSGASEGSVDVPAMSLGSWAESEGLDIIDVLVTDTEGMDAPVLQGATKLLSAGRVRILQFEYHGVGEWQDIQLEYMVEILDGYGYDCFLLGMKDKALRLTGCWAPAYEFKWWSNVMCIDRREEALLATLSSFTTVPV